MKFEIIYRSNYDKNLQLNYICTDVRIKICFETLNKYTKKHIYVTSTHIFDWKFI